MFWERFKFLCDEEGVKPNGIREKIGLTSTGAITAWKNRGVVPERRTLNAIAAYFNTTIAYLLGESDERHAPALPGSETSPSPVGRGDGTAMYAQVEEALIRAGFIQPGQDLSVEDLRMLSAALEIINTTLGRDK